MLEIEVSKGLKFEIRRKPCSLCLEEHYSKIFIKKINVRLFRKSVY